MGENRGKMKEERNKENERRGRRKKKEILIKKLFQSEFHISMNVKKKIKK